MPENEKPTAPDMSVYTPHHLRQMTAEALCDAIGALMGYYSQAIRDLEAELAEARATITRVEALEPAWQEEAKNLDEGRIEEPGARTTAIAYRAVADDLRDALHPESAEAGE